MRNDLARLQGARFVSAVEAEGGHRLAEVLVKQLTGGYTITARFLYSEHVEFVPTFKLWLAVNHTPGVQGTNHAIWRRIRLLPLTVTIPEAERDKRLAEKLRTELPGILRWAVEGCLAWQLEGLDFAVLVQGPEGVSYHGYAERPAYLPDCGKVFPTREAAAAFVQGLEHRVENGLLRC